MQRFAQLFDELDQTTKTNRKVEIMAAYFRDAPEADKLWTIALFSGRRPKRVITTARLRDWAAEQAQLPGWLFEESYSVVGDLAETIALVLPPPQQHSDKPLSNWITWLISLGAEPEDSRKTAILKAWDGLAPRERLVFNKLLTGGFRIGISQTLMTRALAQATGIDQAALTHRLMGDWTPD
ncbi:MAG: ATP-dependent DNA ligase, partial [Mangrovicoccus sp.]